MAWQEIQRGHKWFTEPFPDNVLRVSKSSISLAANIGEQFQSGRITMPSGPEKLMLGLSIDPETKAIQLIPNSLNAFAWHTAARSTRGTLSTRVPIAFVRSGMPVGDYLLVQEGEDAGKLIFKLAE